MTLKTTGLNELLESCNTYSENNSIIKERITDLEARVNDFVIERNYEETKVNAAHVVLKLVTESLKEGLFMISYYYALCQLS